MNVKVSLGISSKSKKNDVDFFKNLFSSMSLQLIEPACPFCGRPMKNASCRCSEFRQAENKLLNKYHQKDLFISTVPKTLGITMVSLSDKVIHTKSVTFNLEMLKLFDYGTVAKNLEHTWFISLGNLHNDLLSFYIREKGHEQVYQCSITNVMQKFANFPNIKVVIQKRNDLLHSRIPQHIIGRYTNTNFNVEIEKISYQTFLTRLKE